MDVVDGSTDWREKMTEAERIIADASDKFERVRADAWAEYQRVTEAWTSVTALIKYKRADAMVRMEREDVEARAWAEYYRVTAPARAEYKRVTGEDYEPWPEVPDDAGRARPHRR